MQQVQSPDGTRTAILFQRDCGATTAFSTQVSVTTSEGQISGKGNAFIADDDSGAAAAGEWGGPWAEMLWTAQDRLLIRFAANSRIFKQEEQVAGVTVSYEPVER